MTITTAFEIVGIVSTLATLVLLRRGRHAPGRDGRRVLAAIVLMMLFFHFGNVLEWSGITAALDPAEDFLWVLLPALWALFFYVCGQELLAERLRESEDRYRGLVELSPEAIFVHRDGEILYANPAASRLLGAASPRNLIGLDVNRYFRDADGRPGVSSGEHALEGRDGTRDVEVVSSPIHFQGASADQVIVHDITARKEAERAFATGARVLESMIEGVCLIDDRGLVLYTNPAQDAMFGCPPGELVGLGAPELYAAGAARQEDTSSQLSESLEARGSWVGEVAHRRRDGTIFSTHARVTAIELEGKRCWLWVSEDLSERKRLEAQLLQAQKMESIGRLAGGIAHDFNNLLTVVVGCTELALAQVSGETGLREPLERVLESAGRASELTRQLLVFARKQVFAPTVLSLNELVAGAEAMLRRLIGEDVALRTRLAPELWNIEADAAQLMQLLVNLAVNARDAMPTGGELVVATGNRSLRNPSQVSTLMPPGDYVTLEIVDSGMGMTEWVQRHLFEPFFTTKDPGVGTGLGLATCYGIVKQNKGFIWVKSEVGSGSTFTIYLPRVLGKLAVVEAPAPALEMPSGTERVLLVEDEEHVRAIAVEVLQKLGYEVLHAGDGAEALELVRSSPDGIALLVTDIVMPRLGGRSLAETLRSSRPELPVLYMSGYPARGQASREVLDDGEFLLQKPFTPLALACKVREVLDDGPPSGD